MTTTTSDVQPIIEPGVIYSRAATATIESVDVEAGTVLAKLVPYEIEADLGDGLHEIFDRGAFAAAVGNPSRVKVSDQQHQRDQAVGKAISLRDEFDGMFGTLKIVDTARGRDLLVLLREGVLDEMSVEFRALRGKFDVVRRSATDVLVRHHKAELVGVSPVSLGAYGGAARVIAVRTLEVDRAREKALAFLDSLTAGRKS